MRGNGNGRGRKIPEILSPDEQTRLLEVLSRSSSTRGGLRNLAMVRLLLDCGLRAAELRSLKICDIDWKTGRLKVVNGKGRKDRVLCVSDRDLELLQAWLSSKSNSSSCQNGNGYVFTSLDGRKPICGRWLRRLIKNLCKKAGIEKDIHVHSLRHSFASNYLRLCKNLFKVSQALGHSSLESTQIYLHLNADELEDMKELCK